MNTNIIRHREGKYFTYINMDHHYKVYKARKALGLQESDDAKRNQTLPDHQLIGKYIYRKSTQKWYLVEKVNKQWYGGFYLGMLIKDSNDSHAFVWFENINNIDTIVLKGIENAKQDFDWKNIKESI